MIKNKISGSDSSGERKINRVLDEINITVQRKQRKAGKSFVSKTRLKRKYRDKYGIVVLRAVIMHYESHNQHQYTEKDSDQL